MNDIDWTSPQNQELRKAAKLQAMRSYRTQEEWESWLIEESLSDCYSNVFVHDCFFCESSDPDRRSCALCYGEEKEVIDDYFYWPCYNINHSERFCRGWQLIKEAFENE